MRTDLNRLLTTLATLSTLLGAVPFPRPRSQGGKVFLWLPKLVGGALSPISGTIGALAALAGLIRRDWWLAGTGLLGAGLAARLASDLPDVDRALAGLPRAANDGPAESRAGLARPAQAPLSGCPGRVEVERNLVFGQNPESGQPLLADLWAPSEHLPTGLGLIYAHGSGWRVGDKDMLTRPFFQRLAAQGHVVLDIAYSLWPAASLPSMVNEVNQAIVWLKEQGPDLGVDPDRIVLMGGSAGGHLALMAAYTAGHPAFLPAGAGGDTSVRGVVAFYPPVDLFDMQDEAQERAALPSSALDRIAARAMKRLFLVQDDGDAVEQIDGFVAEMLGGPVAEVPETYRLLSPICHAGPHCPPTLLLQGSDDIFGLAPAVRRLHECLREAGVPSALIEFPHTEHAFDLALPHISPTARAATRGVEQFLAWLA